ncbi:MAG: hypothetical protein IJW75_02175 [Alphaproteobacteria bacterium]|nr:hypothetical protein [Alphaproteobacteria bacterium]
MKKNLLLTLMVLLSACNADLSQYTNVDANSSAKVKMRACLVNEANSRLNNGTLFTSSVTQTAKDMVGVCIKNLALQSAGLSQESQSTAETIIQNLKNLTTN